MWLRLALSYSLNPNQAELLAQTLTLREPTPLPTSRQQLGAAFAQWQRAEGQLVQRVAAALGDHGAATPACLASLRA